MKPTGSSGSGDLPRTSMVVVVGAVRRRAILLGRVLTLLVMGLSLGVFFLGLQAESSPSLMNPLLLPPTDVRHLSQFELSSLGRLGLQLDSYRLLYTVLDSIFFAVFVGVALILLLRGSGNWVVLAVSATLLMYGSTATLAFVTLSESPPSSSLLASPPLLNFLSTASTASLLLLTFVFPDGRFVPRWTRWVGAGLIVWVAASLFVSWLNPSYWGWEQYPVFAVGLGAGILAQVYRYRHASSPEQRQQLKWVVFGFALASLVYLVEQSLLLAFPVLLAPGETHIVFGIVGQSLFFISQSLVPLFIAVSILRFRLWDIDIIINRTLVYVLVMVFVILFTEIGNDLLQRSLSFLLGGVVSQFYTAPLSLVIAGVASFPAKSRVEEYVNRRFFRDRMELHRTFAELSVELQQTGSRETLLRTILERVCGALGVRQGMILLRGSDGSLYPSESRNMPKTGEKELSGLKRGGEALALLEGEQVVEWRSEMPFSLLVPMSLPASSRRTPLSDSKGATGKTDKPSRLLGVLALGPRLHGLGYSSDDRLLLLGLATQAAITTHFLEEEEDSEVEDNSADKEEKHK